MNQTLDCRGMKCPMPIVRISRAYKELEGGQVLAVEADDPAFRADVEAWATKIGARIVEIEETPSYRRAVIEKP